MTSKLRSIDSPEPVDNPGRRLAGSGLQGKLGRLLKEKLSQPVYFRVSQVDGELVIQQVAFLRSDQLAELIGFDDRTIRGWAAAGKIPSLKPPGSSVNLFELNAVLRWLQGDGTGQE